MKVDASSSSSQSSQLHVSSPVAGGATAYADPAPLLGPRISRLEIVDPETSFSQDEVLALLGMRGDEFAERIFSRCGVRRRRLNLSGDVLATTLQGRTTQIEDELFGYAVTAVQRMEVDPRDIGTVVTATLYSLGGPTLAHRLIDHFEMAPDTDKYHVVGVGCASAVPLMRLVSQALRDHPGKVGLVVAAESMTGILMGACADDAKAKVVGSAIFGDGCAAALLADDPGAEGPEILATKVHQIAGTLDAVSLELAPEDSYLHLDRDLPDVAAADLGELADAFLDSAGLDRAEIDHWIVHPGGRRIIDCVQSALALSDEEVAVSRDVLADHGNIGTPSIFYVLSQTIEQREPGLGELGLVVTVGPGITIGLMLLQW
ncbi:MAG TPA: 3-oxoacyl-[acyl-carrier-protein] synthase III C-terminal domain-containing protein [Solirubrobacteraceae bacterium]|nr:3-oxoacyl-[acyl-carrier-protein] synthase III C-terminal domain-containing protein [Solirubrobacteraceae bacterium]